MFVGQTVVPFARYPPHLNSSVSPLATARPEQPRRKLQLPPVAAILGRRRWSSLQGEAGRGGRCDILRVACCAGLAADAVG